MSNINKAIAIIEECQKIHQNWANWQSGDENWREETEPDDVGDQSHHEEWVEKYNTVLEVLKEARAKLKE